MHHEEICPVLLVFLKGGAVIILYMYYKQWEMKKTHAHRFILYPIEHSSLIYNSFTIKIDLLTKVQLRKYKTKFCEVANTLLALVWNKMNPCVRALEAQSKEELAEEA